MSNNKRQLEGIVVSDKMQKTLVVRVDRMQWHPKYRKQYRVSRKFKVHDEKGEAHTGDRVIITETRPLSKDKTWKLMKIITKV